MITEKNTKSVARIKVEKHFCSNCSVCIKKELQEIVDVTNVRLYPKDSLITFSFTKAYKLSKALNILSEIGYYEKGERFNKVKQLRGICDC